jgi:hypothetical protein
VRVSADAVIYSGNHIIVVQPDTDTSGTGA